MDRGTINRRHALCCGAAAVGGLFTSLVDAAASDASPPRAVPASAQALIDATFDGLDATQLWDAHTHLLGTGDAGSGCSVHPHLDSWWHPLEAVRKRVILHGAGVAQGSRGVDRDYVRRLAALAADFPSGARWLLFAFDHAHDEQGASDPARTTFHVPDAWAAHVARTHDDRFGWVASIHPYRDDALARLRHALAQGALAVKWLPSAMNIDLRNELFARLMDEREWQGLLLGDVSALFLANRNPAVWRTVLAREDWHARLLHGSDYPLPCVAPLVRLAPLVRAGVLDPNEVDALQALREHNPLLFDLALKRRAAWRGARLSAAVFQTRDQVVDPRRNGA